MRIHPTLELPEDEMRRLGYRIIDLLVDHFIGLLQQKNGRLCRESLECRQLLQYKDYNGRCEMAKKIDLKSSKTEILEAYDNLKAKMEEFSSRSIPDKRVEEIIKAEEQKIVEKASSYTVEKIIKDFADLNLHVGKALTELSERLAEEAKKLEEVNRAIAVETGELETVRDIRVASDALALLIQEIDQKREEWKKEETAHELFVKERDAAVAKERRREEDEYQYNLTLSRKKEEGAYEQERALQARLLQEEKEAREKAFADREAALSARESELKELREKAGNFQAALETAVKAAEEKVRSEERNKAQTAALLASKETEGEKKVLELKIASLQETVAKQGAQVESLTRQLSEANNQVQAIAVKAIEGASGSRTLSTVQEIALEQAKQAKIQK